MGEETAVDDGDRRMVEETAVEDGDRRMGEETAVEDGATRRSQNGRMNRVHIDAEQTERRA